MPLNANAAPVVCYFEIDRLFRDDLEQFSNGCEAFPTLRG